MHVSFRHCLQCLVPPAALLVALVACSPQGADTASTDAPQATAPRDDYAAPSPAEFEALRAEGPEGLARRLVPNDLWLHYKVMEASGMVDALGGEEKGSSRKSGERPQKRNGGFG